jgi:hypothetical protein
MTAPWNEEGIKNVQKVSHFSKWPWRFASGLYMKETIL